MTSTVPGGGYSPKPAARTFSPRRRLPSGRAVVGALLVTVAAVGAFAVASREDQGPGTSFLIATRSVRQGTPVSSEDVSLAPMDLPDTAAANAIDSAAGVQGAIAVGDLAAGEVISTGDLIAAPTAGGAAVGAVHEVTLPVSVDRIPDLTVAGDRVTLLATVSLDDEPATVLAAEDALVLKWDGDAGAGGSGVLTLALDDADAVMGVTHLSRQGAVTVVRTTRAISDEYPLRLSTLDLLGGKSESAPQDGPVQTLEAVTSDDR